MIEPDSSVFPNNIIEMIRVRVSVAIDPDMTVILRPLRHTDPNQSLGIYASTWNGDEDSHEMAPTMVNIPTLQNYRVFVQSLVKDGDEVRALNVHGVVAKKIREMLYLDQTLQVAFSQLVDASGGKTEKAMLWGLQAQRYMSNEISGSFIQSSISEFWLQTAIQ
jgi:hypothetical protein